MVFYNLPVSPYVKASCISRQFFWWLNEFFGTGCKRELKIKDLYQPIPSDKSSLLGPLLAAEWGKQYAKYLSQLEESRKLGGGAVKKLSKNQKIKKPSLAGAVIKVFLRRYMLMGILAVVEECFVRIVQPICLGFMIRYFTTHQQVQPGREHREKYPVYVLYVTAGGIILMSIMYVLVHHVFFFGVSHVGMQVRVACSSLLYRKALVLSQLSLQKTAIGQVVNLLSNDVGRFDWVTVYCHYLWIGPLQLALVTIILWFYIGPYCFIGLAILVLIVPLQVLFAKIFSIFRKNTAVQTDKRIRILSEIISGIRVIKMYTWEKPFSQFVGNGREAEMVYIKKTSQLRAFNMTMYLTSSKIIVFVTLLVYVLTGNGLSSELVFVTMALFNNVRLVMTLFFPNALAAMAETRVCIGRLEDFLLLDEQDLSTTNNSNDGSEMAENDQSGSSPPPVGVTLKEVTAKWNPEKRANTITNISLRVEAGKLFCICGHVGSGKGSILHTILRELPVLTGSVQVIGKIGYVAQEPWLFSGSVKENILFGLPYKEDWYGDVIEACALQDDLELLPYGDNTLVSDRGQTLSGGQKARITLARAVYTNADIYLLDDPLSAVDATVGQHLFSKCINGILKDKARILVTHQLQFLKFVDHIIVLDNGRIQVEGSYLELVKKGFDFEQLAEAIKIQASVMSVRNKDILLPSENFEENFAAAPKEPAPTLVAPSEISEKTPSKISNRTSSIKYADPNLVNLVVRELGGDGTKVGNEGGVSLTPVTTSEVGTPLKTTGGFLPPVAVADTRPPRRTTNNDKEAPEEVQEQQKLGGVAASLYCKYFRAGSHCCTVFFLILVTLLCQLFFTGSDYWLTVWTEAEESHYVTGKKYKNRHDALDYLYNSRNVQLYGYTIIITIVVITSWMKAVLFFHVCMRASINLHRKMFEGIIRAPMLFFEENSAGRILNRFSKDMGQIDESLPPTIFEATTIFLNVFGTLIIIGCVNPYLLIPAFVLCLSFYFLRKIYMRTASSVKRLEGIAKSPVFSHLGTSLYGLTTIRAFKAEEEFIRQFDAHQDLHTASWYLFLATSRWFGVWLDWISVIFIAFVTFSFAFVGNSGAQVGLAVSSAMTLAGYFQWGIRQASEVENQMVSTERVMEYTELKHEAELTSPGDKKPPGDWPQNGAISFRNLSLFYGDHAVLKGVTFDAKGSEKIGIVGRTGAGKSTLITVIFRLAEPSAGDVIIDNVNVANIGLHDLRKKVSIIPQEPVLFSGTLRKNLDPFDSYSDAEIWSALEWAHLAREIRQFPLGLDAAVAEGGSNFSVGQRQLLCLGRAVLKNNKILVLDEATASVDVETDSLIQKTIESRFQTSTVLTIAHRLHTVMHCDKMLVLDAGRVMEFDEPHTLLQDKNSLLRSLVDQTGKESADELMKQAKAAHDRRIHNVSEQNRTS